MLDRGVQGKTFFLAKAGSWVRIVVAKQRCIQYDKNLGRQRFARAMPGKQAVYTTKGLVYLALLLHLEHARQYIFP